MPLLYPSDSEGGRKDKTIHQNESLKLMYLTNLFIVSPRKEKNGKLWEISLNKKKE